MSFLKQLNESEKKKKINKKIDLELPYFITLVTVLASSGFGPYTIFKKMMEMELLPHIRIESKKIIKRIDILGMDPLTVMNQVKQKGVSKLFSEFLSGYVSAIEGGGDVVNYLKNKMNSAFESYENTQKESIEKVRTLIEAYMTVQIVVLAVYIIITSTNTSESSSEGFETFYLVTLLPPTVSAIFLFIGKQVNKSKISELDWKKIAMFGMPGMMIVIVLSLSQLISDYNAYAISAGLIIASIWPAIKFQKIYLFALDSESASPRILRDIAEARKAGLGPEKCVIHATKRDDYGAFNKVSNSIANKLEWGVSLKNIYESLEKEIKNFQILINFRILFEIISAGGGNVQTLQSLAGTAEKIQNIEKMKLEMLKPYIMIGFMIIGITGFVTLLVIDSITSISLISETDELRKAEIELEAKNKFELLSISILSQSWLAGLFLGKITTGLYSGGFKLSIFLVIITTIAIVLIQQSIFTVSGMF